MDCMTDTVSQPQPTFTKQDPAVHQAMQNARAQNPQPAMLMPMKSVGVAYLLLIVLGVFGGHQFYLGKIGRGVAYLLTFGFLGIGVLIDLFTLQGQVRKVNMEIQLGLRQP